MKRVLAIITAVAITAAATAALATIKNSKHDLSSGFVGGTGPDQICVFCHTPHNAIQNIPLWNRSNNSGTAFKFYSSPSMTLHRTTLDKFESTSISLFCMSCHDGGAIGARIVNNGGAIVGETKAYLSGDVILGTEKANFGTDLSNDHPVNLKLAAGGQNAIYAPSATNKIGNGLTTKLPLYKGTGGDNYIECASCHAVHEPGSSTKFLRTTNSGSKLCLACHNK